MCFFIGILETISNLSIGVFKPIYYSDIMSFDTATKGSLHVGGGIAYLPIGLAVPALADNFPLRRLWWEPSL